MRHHMIRVFLHYGDDRHYRHLEQSLHQRGIVPFLRLKTGKSYRLPTGEYYLHSHLGIDEIREQVFEIASQIGKASVLVTSAEKIAWVGLDAC
jgi:hypothetical protein